MSRFVDEIREKIPHDIFTHTELVNAISGSKDKRYGLIKRAIAGNEIIHVRRGLYAFAKRYQRTPLNAYELSQKIYNPSYVSLESALSYHGLIPEGVRTITSACAHRSREFSTPVGEFSFARISCFNFIGVERIAQNESSFFMAEPAKALVDFMYVYKKDWKNSKPLIEDLRIESDDLHSISKDILAELIKTYQSKRVHKFVKGLMEDLKL